MGLPTPKEVTITSDGTPPELSAPSKFFTVAGGWLEQKSYIAVAGAKDPGGSGVTSFALKIDGVAVKSATQSCSNGGCQLAIGASINMAAYKGGSHPAELIATDGAGNTAKKAWTINVDPKGTIPAPEAAATIEAVEETEPEASYIAPTKDLISAEEIAAGNDPGLEQSGTQLTSTGVPVETLLTTNPSEGMTIEAPEDSIHVEPTGEDETAPSTVVKEEVAAVTSNTEPSVDTIVRPQYNGDMTFQSIRDASSPETYSWEVDLGSRLSLAQIDSQTVGVYHPDGSEAMLISAIKAHDALGKEVSTTLTLESPNVITLTVQHRAAGVTYPVVTGAAFEVGYEYVETYDPPPPSQEEVYWESDELIVSAPEPIPSGEATISTTGGSRQTFVKVICGHLDFYDSDESDTQECGNPFTGNAGFSVVWQAAMRGAFLYKPSQWAEQKGAKACAQDAHQGDKVFRWAVKEAYECHYGPKTSDENGGQRVSAGHYLRAQAHWELGHYASCADECSPNPTIWEDKALELHLWPSGLAETIVP